MIRRFLAEKNIRRNLCSVNTKGDVVDYDTVEMRV